MRTLLDERARHSIILPIGKSEAPITKSNDQYQATGYLVIEICSLVIHIVVVPAVPLCYRE